MARSIVKNIFFVEIKGKEYIYIYSFWVIYRENRSSIYLVRLRNNFDYDIREIDSVDKIVRN